MSNKENPNIPWALSVFGIMVAGFLVDLFLYLAPDSWFVSTDSGRTIMIIASVSAFLTLYTVYMLIIRAILKGKYPVFFGYPVE